MSRGLTPNEFYKALAKEYNTETQRIVSEDKIKDIWVAFCELVITEMLQYGSIKLPLLGTMIAVEAGDKEVIVPNSESDKQRLHTTDKQRKVYISSYLRPKFSFTDGFINTLNGKKPSRYQTFNMRKQIRKEQEVALREEQENIVKNKDEIFQQICQNRLDKIHKTKEDAKLSKRKQNQLVQQEKIDNYGY